MQGHLCQQLCLLADFVLHLRSSRLLLVAFFTQAPQGAYKCARAVQHDMYQLLRHLSWLPSLYYNVRYSQMRLPLDDHMVMHNSFDLDVNISILQWECCLRCCGGASFDFTGWELPEEIGLQASAPKAVAFSYLPSGLLWSSLVKSGPPQP